MAPPDKPKPALPADLLPLIQKSAIWPEKQFQEIRAKVLKGDLPFDPKELAQKLMREGLLSEYQARRLLSGKPHGLSLGKYIIVDRIGSGSMGRVFKAQHVLMGRTVALKIIAPEVASNPRVVSRFQREMKLVGRLDHPHVVRAFDADKLGETLYIVMEFVAGTSLGQRYRSQGVVPVAEMLEYASQAAIGLGHAHAQGVVHRDVKPSNLLVADDNHVKVLDLGLGVLMEADQNASFATQDGIAVGTIDYMSPEQARGADVDGRSDVYSLGCVIYHLTSGTLPFPGDSPIERLGKRINNTPQPLSELVPDLSTEAQLVLDKMMAIKPRERFQTAEDASDALRNALGLRKLSKRGTSAKSGDTPNHDLEPAPKIIEKVVEVTVEVMPDFPAWLRPFNEFALVSPLLALAIVITIPILLFALGLFLGLILRS